MNIWVKSSLISVVATSFSIVLALTFGWTSLDQLNWLEVAAVITSYMCTFMCVHQTRWNYPIGILTTFLYSWLFYQWEMYGVAAFNLYLVFSLTYGWFRWGPDGNTRPVTSITGFWGLGYLALGFLIGWACMAVYGAFGVTISGTELLIVAASGVAQFMLDNKKIENWIIWVIVNIASIIFYSQGGLYLVAVQYVFFLANAFYGYYMWNKDHEQSYRTPDGVTLH